MNALDAANLLGWIIEQSATDTGEMAHVADLAIEEATDLLAEALS